MNRSRCSTAQPCHDPVGQVPYFKQVYGGVVFAVIALCILLLAVHVVALHRHEKKQAANG